MSTRSGVRKGVHKAPRSLLRVDPPRCTHEATEALLARRTTPEAGKVSSGGALMETVGTGVAARCARKTAGALSMPRKLVTTSCAQLEGVQDRQVRMR